VASAFLPFCAKRRIWPFKIFGFTQGDEKQLSIVKTDAIKQISDQDPKPQPPPFYPRSRSAGSPSI
jgi:hypothetical protein